MLFKGVAFFLRLLRAFFAFMAAFNAFIVLPMFLSWTKGRTMQYYDITQDEMTHALIGKAVAIGMFFFFAFLIRYWLNWAHGRFIAPGTPPLVKPWRP